MTARGLTGAYPASAISPQVLPLVLHSCSTLYEMADEVII